MNLVHELLHFSGKDETEVLKLEDEASRYIENTSSEFVNMLKSQAQDAMEQIQDCAKKCMQQNVELTKVLEREGNMLLEEGYPELSNDASYVKMQMVRDKKGRKDSYRVLFM